MSLRTFVFHFCQWCNSSSWGHGVRDSVWLFPFIEIFHLLALGVLGGTILLLNLRLVGFGFRDEPLPELAREVRPWMLGSLAVMFVSGFLLFSTEAVKMYGNIGFRYKMVFLFFALIYTFTIHLKLTASDETRVAPVWRWLAAFVSIALWAGVGVGGRSIGYV